MISLNDKVFFTNAIILENNSLVLVMELFKTNQNNSERVLRFIVAMVLVPAPLLLGLTTYPIILCSVGVILLFNALVGTCMIYKLLGIDTCKV